MAPSHDPVVWGRGREAGRAPADSQDRREVGDDAAGWSEKLELARRYAAGGYDEQALQILDAALAQKPPSAWAGKLRGLKTSLRVRHAQEALLRVDARGRKDYVTFGEPIDLVIRLRNVSAETISFLPPGEDEDRSSPSALMLELTRRDRDIHATELRRTWNETVYLQHDGEAAIRIPAGGSYDIPVRIAAEAAGPPLAGLRTIDVTGTLRPTRMRQGSEPLTVRLPIRRGRVMVLPRGFEPLTIDPLRSMGAAIDAVAPAHLLIATEFVPSTRRPAAVALLTRALEKGHPALYRAALGGLDLLREQAAGRPLAPLARPLMTTLGAAPERPEALMEGLSTLTGVRLAADPRLWQEWWRRAGTQQKTITAPEVGGSSHRKTP